MASIGCAKRARRASSVPNGGTLSESKPVDVEQMILEGTLIDEAIRRAIEDTLRLHKKLGMPVVGWKDGKAVWIPANEIEVADEPDA